MADKEFLDTLKEFKDRIPVLWLYKLYEQDPYVCLNCGRESHYWEEQNLVRCFRCHAAVDSVEMVKRFDSTSAKGWFTTIKTTLDFLKDNPLIFGHYELLESKDGYSAFELKIKEVDPNIENNIKHWAAHYTNSGETYYQKRGISSLLIEKFELGENEEGYTIPVKMNGIVMNVITRLKHEYGKLKVKNLKDHTIIPFNMDSLKEAETVYIVEGWADALSILTIFENNPKITAIALNSTSMVKRFIATVNHMKIDLRDKRFILGFDTDKAGIKATDDMTMLLKAKYNIEALTINLGDHNDINDLLVADKEQLEKVLNNPIDSYKKAIKRTRESLGF